MTANVSKEVLTFIDMVKNNFDNLPMVIKTEGSGGEVMYASKNERVWFSVLDGIVLISVFSNNPKLLSRQEPPINIAYSKTSIHADQNSLQSITGGQMDDNMLMCCSESLSDPDSLSKIKKHINEIKKTYEI